MDETRGMSRRSTQPSALLILLCIVGSALVAVLVTSFGNLNAFDSQGLPTANRTLNQFTAVMLTCIALIVPLTSNLYTPRLVRLYATHPLLVVGLGVLILSHILSLSINFFPPGHRAHHPLILAISGCYLLVMAGALPFLYGISQFLRPSYFMPMLTRKGVADLKALRGRVKVTQAGDFFDTVDVLTNLALTGMGRGDRQLVLLSLQAFHVLLMETIAVGVTHPGLWSAVRPRFVPGLAREGQAYLTREGIWPEGYLLAQTLKVLESANRRQHEIVAELAGQLVETCELAVGFGRETVVELHMMAFNSLMREALDEKDLRRFQNLSYHYRLLVEALRDIPQRMHEAAQNLIHYGRVASREKLHFGFETVIYDLGELILSLGRYREAAAIELLEVWVGPLWQECLDNPALRKVAWRTLARTYWEVKALGLEQLTSAIYWRYLSDRAVHQEQLEILLEENRELHFEFNDRLMRFAHVSPAAVELAQDFLMRGEEE